MTKLKTVEEVGKTCSKCKSIKPLSEYNKDKSRLDGYCHYCRVCGKAHSRKMFYKFHEKYLLKNRGVYLHRKKRGEFIDEYKKKKAKAPEKIRARNVVTTAVKYGKLKRKPCEVCGDLKVQAHHTDYFKPLEVHWLCVTHHMEQHRRVTLLQETLGEK